MFVSACGASVGFNIQELKYNETLGAGYEHFDGKLFSIFCGGNSSAEWSEVNNKCMHEMSKFVYSKGYEYFSVIDRKSNTSRTLSSINGNIYTIKKHGIYYYFVLLEEGEKLTAKNFYKVTDYYTPSSDDISKQDNSDAKEAKKLFNMCKRTWADNELVLEAKLDSFCNCSIEKARSYANGNTKDIDIDKLTKATENCLIINIDAQRIEELYDICEKNILKEEGIVLTADIRDFCRCQAEKSYEYSEKGTKDMSQAFQKALKRCERILQD